MTKRGSFFNRFSRKPVSTQPPVTHRDLNYREKQSSENTKTIPALPKTREELLDSLRKASGLGYELGRKKEEKDERRNRLYRTGVEATVGITGAAAGAYVAENNPVLNRKDVEKLYEMGRTAKAANRLIQQAINSKDRKKLDQAITLTKKYSQETARSLEQYKTALADQKQNLKEIKMLYERVGSLAQNAPCYDTEAIKYLSQIRNHIAATTAQTLTGKNQRIRLDENYGQNYNALLDRISDAIIKKQLSKAQIRDIVKELATTTEKNQASLDKSTKAIDETLSQFKKYNEIIMSPDSLKPEEIRDMAKEYRTVIEKANSYGLEGTSREAKMAGMGYDVLGGLMAGILAAYVIGKPMGKIAYNTKKLIKKLKGNEYHIKQAEKEINEIAREVTDSSKISKLESKVETVLLGVAGTAVIFLSNPKVSGNVIASRDLSLINYGLFAAILIFLYILARKIYKSKKR